MQLKAQLIAHLKELHLPTIRVCFEELAETARLALVLERLVEVSPGMRPAHVRGDSRPSVDARESGYIQTDETPIPVQDPEEKGETHRCYYWVYHAPPQGLVIQDDEPGRGRAGPNTWLANYDGALQTWTESCCSERTRHEATAS